MTVVADRVIDFPTARVFKPLLAPARYKGAWGGRGSAKSHEFAKSVLRRCLSKPGTRVVCVREIQRTLAQSVKLLLEDKITEFGLDKDFTSLTSEIRTPGDGIIIFQGMQDHTAESIKSLQGFDVAWVEEAQNLSANSLKLLRPTIREPGSELWFSWNPRSSTDPVDILLRHNPPPSSVVVRANYDDNPWFPDVLRAEMEWDRARDPEKYLHVWRGEYEQRAESRVFRNYIVEEFDDPPGLQWYYGADWGYSADPSTLIRVAVQGKRLLMSHEAYRIGCEIDDLPALFDTVPGSREHVVKADSARPETISWLRRHGFPHIIAAHKGPNSVKEGVIFLQNLDVVIHPRCEHAIIEFANYRYATDRSTGEVKLPLVLVDKENHIIDPTRYALEDFLQPQEDDWLVVA